MGQARLRGTKEDRVAEAKAKAAEFSKQRKVKVAKAAGKGMLVAALAITATEMFLRGVR